MSFLMSNNLNDFFQLFLEKSYLMNYDIISKGVNYMSKEFGERLKYLRKKEKLTQSELGVILGVGRSTISEYERGTIEPKTKVLTMISDYFKVPMEYLLDDMSFRVWTNVEIYPPTEPMKTEIIDVSIYIQDMINYIDKPTKILINNKKYLTQNQEIFLKESLKNIIKMIDLL